MAKTRVAINGFGRIGRLVLRAYMEAGRNDLDFVLINDLGPTDANARLLKYDSVHGIFPGEISTTEDSMTVNGDTIKVMAERDPSKLPLGDLGIDIMLECTGIFRNKDKAMAYIEGGAKKVLVSAPSGGADKTIVYGVNHETLSADDQVVSNASCTTNCLAPVADILNKTVGIKQGFMTTIHSYTGDQRIVDTLHSDPYRSRAGAVNMIPTSTGAAAAVGLVLPELLGKLDGVAIRVPTPNVSLVDLKFNAGRDTTVEEINEAIKEAAEGPLKGILGYNTEPLVSSDYNHNPNSSTFDAPGTRVIDGSLVRIMSWYDNEWGFSNRMSDTAVYWGAL